MTIMDELVPWLRVQLDEDERKVAAMEREENRARTAPIFQSHPLGWLAGVDIFVSSKRWRAEVDAMRLLLDTWETWLREKREAWADYLEWIEGRATGDAYRHTVHEQAGPGLEIAIRLRAMPYADRPGYRKAWTP